MSVSDDTRGLGALASPSSTSPGAPPPVQSCVPSAIQGMQPTPDSDSGIRVEADGLYILLWSTGCDAKYHWALMIAQTEATGIIFHQTTVFQDNNNNNNNIITNNGNNNGNNTPDPDVWKFVADPVNVAESPGLLCALKVGVLEDAHSDEWIGAVKQCVHDFGVPATEDLTCRVWVLGALHELAESGFIGMVADRKRIAGTIEIEARRLARDAELLGVGMVTESQMFAF